MCRSRLGLHKLARTRSVLYRPIRIAFAGNVPAARAKANLQDYQKASTLAKEALGGNLGGVTSWLFSLDGGSIAHRTRVDIVLPVLGFKRCYDPQLGYEFLYPADWLADQTLFRRAVQRAEQARSLDLPRVLKAIPRNSSIVEPSAAFGPPNTSGEENISAIRAPIELGTELEKFGTPYDVATRLIDTQIAPPSSRKTAQLLHADTRSDENGQTYYVMEYTVETTSWRRHNLSVLATRDGYLYTWNAMCPDGAWRERERRLRQACESFRLVQ